MKAMRAKKVASPEALAKKAAQERRAAERESKKATLRRLHEYLAEEGIVIPSAEEREARWKARSAKAQRLSELDERTRKTGHTSSELAARYNFSPGPKTWQELRCKSGPHAGVLENYVLSIGARRWACDNMERKGNAVGHPSGAIRIAFDFYSAQLWRDVGASRRGVPALCDLKPETRSELEEIVADTLAEYTAADQTGLDEALIWEGWRYMHGHIWAGELEAYPGCMPEPDGWSALGLFNIQKEQ